MGRRVGKFVMGAPGICNVCGRPCCTLDQVGIECYHCHVGEFVHRRYWHQRACSNHVVDCRRCDGSGVVTVPIEDDRVWEYKPGIG